MNTHTVSKTILSSVVACFIATVAQAWHVSGRVLCDENETGQIDSGDHAVAGVTVVVENSSGSFTTAVNTAADGTFVVDLPHSGDSYLVYLHPPSVPAGSSILLPPGGVYSFSLTEESQFFDTADFLLDCMPDVPPPPPDADCGKITGGGWIVDTPSGEKASFAISGGTRRGELWGHLNYIDHGTGMHVRSTAVTGFDDDPSTLNGRIIRFNVMIGTTAGTAVCRAVDNGEPGRDDIFEITLSVGNYSAGGSIGGAGKGGGNIQLHTCPPGWTKPKKK